MPRSRKFRSEAETIAKEEAIADQIRDDKPPKVTIEDLDSNLTQQAEDLYENLIEKEGFSEEQAFNIALTRTGKEGGLLDEGFEAGESEDELIIHEATGEEEEILPLLMPDQNERKF
jgi:hypothetical protein